jgi:uncharacterized lipoprotein YbaY
MTTQKEIIDDDHLWLVLRNSHVQSSHRCHVDAGIQARDLAFVGNQRTHVVKVTATYTPVTSISVTKTER